MQESVLNVGLNEYMYAQPYFTAYMKKKHKGVFQYSIHDNREHKAT